MRRTLLLCVACSLAACTSALFPNVQVQPATDEEGDGVIGSDDQCPHTPEDVDGFRDTDGCHDADDDGDAIADESDRCRCVAEDRDGFEDDDGCPDVDDDRDRIVDACDACPRDPETYNACLDDDGCPDHGHVAIAESRLVIVESVEFGGDSFEIEPRAQPILDAIAATLRGNPRFTRISIVGHADASEPRADRLGQERAEAVREWLLAHGVEPGRLDVTSAGATRPTAPSAIVAQRARNRRVTFEITEYDGAPYDAASPPPTVSQPDTSCTSSWQSPCAEDGPPQPIDVCAMVADEED